jgi:hypothetical protein
MGVGDYIDVIHFNNPTGMAAAALSAAILSSGPILDSFLEAGGVPALVRLLRDSACPLTPIYAAGIIDTLLRSQTGPSARRGRPGELADRFLRAGA